MRLSLPKILCFILLLLASRLCAADVYGFVDAEGVVHLSTEAIDERYFLFRKQAEGLSPPTQAVTTEDMSMQPATTVVEGGRVAYASKPLAALIAQVSRENDVDAALVHAVIAVESGFNHRAHSPKGARGLMQLMPATAERFGVIDVWNPLENVRAGTRYLRHLLTLFKENVSLALAAYNAGEGAVIAAGHNIPPYAETRSYVPKVLRLLERARGQSSASQ